MTLLSRYLKIIFRNLKISHVSSSIVSLLWLVAKLTNPEKKNFGPVVFWIVTPRSLVYKRRRLFETCCLIFETELFYLKSKAVRFFKCRHFSYHATLRLSQNGNL